MSFISPGYNSSNYWNKRLCVYNISVDNCESGVLTVRSTSDNHTLYDDGRDYLYLEFGHVTTRVRGGGVSMLRETVQARSLTAVFWSDSCKKTSAGRFKMEAVCEQTLETDH